MVNGWFIVWLTGWLMNVPAEFLGSHERNGSRWESVTGTDSAVGTHCSRGFDNDWNLWSSSHLVFIDPNCFICSNQLWLTWCLNHFKTLLVKSIYSATNMLWFILGPMERFCFSLARKRKLWVKISGTDGDDHHVWNAINVAWFVEPDVYISYDTVSQKRSGWQFLLMVILLNQSQWSWC